MPRRLTFFNCTQKPYESVSLRPRSEVQPKRPNIRRWLTHYRNSCVTVHALVFTTRIWENSSTITRKMVKCLTHLKNTLLEQTLGGNTQHQHNIMYSAASKVEQQVYRLTNKPPARIAQPLSQALTAPIATWLKTTLQKCAGLSKTSSKKILRSTQNPTGIHPQSMQTMSNSSQRTHPHPTCLMMTTTSSTLSVFAHHHGNDSTKDDMYFTWLPASISPNKTINVSMQVDSAATCNTLPSPIDRKISESAPL